MENILVFAAHPDDEVLGLGGTVRRLTDEGAIVRAVIMAEGLTSRKTSREEVDSSLLFQLQEDTKKAADIIGYKSIEFCGLPDNRMDGVELLDVIKLVSKYVEKYQPDTIFTHHHGDLNIDHRITCEAVLTACRPIGDYTVKRIYAFETLSSTEWDFNYTNPFMPNIYFDIEKTLDAKLMAMKCYHSELRDFPHPRSMEGIQKLAGLRGSQVGCSAAEAYMLIREIV